MAMRPTRLDVVRFSSRFPIRLLAASTFEDLGLMTCYFSISAGNIRLMSFPRSDCIFTEFFENLCVGVAVLRLLLRILFL